MTSRDTIYLLALALPPSPTREAILLTCVQAERLAALRERQTVRELASEACARECRKPCGVMVTRDPMVTPDPRHTRVWDNRV